jgi:hypothetical protein
MDTQQILAEVSIENRAGILVLDTAGLSTTPKTAKAL